MLSDSTVHPEILKYVQGKLYAVFTESFTIQPQIDAWKLRMDRHEQFCYLCSLKQCVSCVL